MKNDSIEDKPKINKTGVTAGKPGPKGPHNQDWAAQVLLALHSGSTKNMKKFAGPLGRGVLDPLIFPGGCFFLFDTARARPPQGPRAPYLPALCPR